MAADVAVALRCCGQKKAPVRRGLMKKECVAVPWSKHFAAYAAFPLLPAAYFLYDGFMLRDVLFRINHVKRECLSDFFEVL